MILLLVLTEFGQPIQLEESRKKLDGPGAGARPSSSTRSAARADTAQPRAARARSSELEKEQHARWRGSRAISPNVRGQYSASRSEASVTNIVESELVSAYQTLTAEMQRLLKQQPQRQPSDTIGGIPIDSEYIIFIIDTSASMTSNHWDAAHAGAAGDPRHLPAGEGHADHGRRGQGDARRARAASGSTTRRRSASRSSTRMKAWRAFSNSSPVEGIEEAIRSLLGRRQAHQPVRAGR